MTGSLLILLSTVFYATHGVWSKSLIPYFDMLSSSWTRSLIVVILLVPLLLIQKGFVWPKRADVRWLLVITVPGALVTPLYFYAFEHLSVGVATLVFFTCYTFGALIYGKLFFSERFTRVKIIALLLGLTGLVLVASPYLQSASLLAIIACAFAGFCGAAEITFTKKLPAHYSGYYITFLVYLMTAIITLGLAVTVGGGGMPLPVTMLPWLLSLGYAVTIIAAIVLVIRGFKTTEPSVGGIIGLMEIVFGVIFGVLFFSEQISLVVFAGAMCILVAGLLPIVGKGKNQSRRTSAERQRVG